MKYQMKVHAISLALGVLLAAAGWHFLTWQFWAWIVPMHLLLVLRDSAERAKETQACWDEINAWIKPGELQGNGCDATAQRNGMILASNIVMERMVRSNAGGQATGAALYDRSPAP